MSGAAQTSSDSVAHLCKKARNISKKSKSEGVSLESCYTYPSISQFIPVLPALSGFTLGQGHEVFAALASSEGGVAPASLDDPRCVVWQTDFVSSFDSYSFWSKQTTMTLRYLGFGRRTPMFWPPGLFLSCLPMVHW